MAPRKKPATILKRDRAFTEAIGRPASGKPSAFSMATEDFKARLEATRAGGTSRSPEVRASGAGEPGPADTVAQPEAPEAADRQDAAGTDATPPRVPDLPDSQGIEGQAAPDGGDEDTSGQEAKAQTKLDPAEMQPKDGETGAAETVEVIVSIMVSKELVERAGRWAAIARQPAPTVLRHALKKMKPQLLDELRTIRIEDMPNDHTEKAGYRLQSRLRFTPAELADMQARLDPAGFGILSAMLNQYARDSFAGFLDRLLADAGY